MVVDRFTRTVLPHLGCQFNSVRQNFSVMEYFSDAYLRLHSLDQAATASTGNVPE